MRHVGVFAAAAVVAGVVVASASGALFLLFDPTSAAPGERVTLRLGGTPRGFTADDRRPPLRRAIRVYLVPNEIAPDVRSRFDPRLHFGGALVPDRDGRGALTFRAPPLDSGEYAVAAWCPECAATSAGRSFFVLPKPASGAFRRFQTLRLRMPDPAASCPVTRGRYGNGFLSVHTPEDGVLRARPEPDGTFFDKLGWLPKKNWSGVLRVRGERLDAPGKLRVLSVNWGYSFPSGRGSWASAVVFPSEGCWRLTGRVRDIAISYVVRVVGGR